MGRINIIFFLLLFGLPFITSMSAQCATENKYFVPGEVLTYDLYFKYGILNTKAGNSSLKVEEAIYKGRNVYKMTLTAKSSGVAKSVFSLTDTVTSYVTKDLTPLAYMKDAHEGGDHTVERATYDYSAGQIKLRNINTRNGRLRYDTTFVSKDCMYDMLSIVYYARTLNYDSMEKGDKVTVSFFSGRKKMNMDIEHEGIANISANDGRKYSCVKLVLVLNDDAFADRDEAMKVFITNDPNRIPVRIDSKLKVGSTKVVLKAYKGQRN